MKSPTARTHHWIGSIRLQKSHGSPGIGYTSQDTEPGRSYEDFFLGTKNCCSSYQCLMLSWEMTYKPPILYVLLAHFVYFTFALVCLALFYFPLHPIKICIVCLFACLIACVFVWVVELAVWFRHELSNSKGGKTWEGSEEG